ncbi:MAG: hypothetical protein EXS03_02720 [Phycisphaerales bacterium]|nr:hypothetical protein [Phycisphaerales bacterium]
MNFRRRKRAIHHAEAHADTGSGGPPGVLSHALVPQDESQLIESIDQVKELTDHLHEAGAFAFDTEFIGEESFYPRICLIQIATTRRVALLDPITLGEKALEPIWNAVCCDSLTTIVHAGGQDIDAAQRSAGCAATNVVDTQIAAAFLGMPWPVSLGNVVHGLTAHRLHKGHTFTEWDKRPLTKSQLSYAADDVRYLPLVWSVQCERLAKCGRADWAREESQESLRTSEEFNPESQVRRAARGLGLRPRIMTVLRELVVLRHALAKELNLPPRTVIPDGPLLEVARTRIAETSGLGEVRGFPRHIASSHGDEIVRTIVAARALPLDRDRIWMAPEESAEDRTKIDALWSIITMRCISMGLSTGLVLTRAELSRWYLARGTSRAPLFPEGSWRAQAIGSWLDGFLDGRETLSLAWRDGGPVVP